jgi:hypothetical protein
MHEESRTPVSPGLHRPGLDPAPSRSRLALPGLTLDRLLPDLRLPARQRPDPSPLRASSRLRSCPVCYLDGEAA